MIPYDDLVDALNTWRARQGLPVAVTAPRAPVPSPARSAPPVAPPRASSPIAAGPISSDDFDEGALIEDAPYDAGDDYVLPLGGLEPAGETTAIGVAPEAPKRW
jgi:hypothetical protein